MAKYRKKPVVIEALKWDGSAHRPMFDFLGGDPQGSITTYGDNFFIDFNRVEGGLVIKTFEGECPANIGEYIVKGVKGEYYPCKADIFEATHEEAD